MANNTVTEPLVFGITIDQADDLARLSNTAHAVADVFDRTNAGSLDPSSIKQLGCVALEAAHGIRLISERIQEQRIADRPSQAATTEHKGGVEDRPPFDNGMHTLLVQAGAIVEVINTAAYQADGADGIGGAAWAVTDILAKVVDYIEFNFDYLGEARA